MSNLVKYSDLKPFDVFKWNNSTYVWLGDRYDSIMCIDSPSWKNIPQENRKNDIYAGGLVKYETVDLMERETTWEVIGQMVQQAKP